MTDKPDRDHNPGDDPREVQREAEGLQPNQDTADNRENIAEDEMGVPGEDKLDASERQSRPLTRPEDNAKVDRVVSESKEPEPAPPKARDYLISPRGLRNLFIASNVAGVAIIIFILTLASSGPQGRLTPADETQYQRTLQGATDAISTAARNEGEQTARIPIDEAITLVAEKGLGSVAEALAAPATPANPAPTEGSAASTAPEDTAPGQQAGQTAQAPAQQPAQQQAQPAQAPQVQSATPASANLDLSAGEAV